MLQFLSGPRVEALASLHLLRYMPAAGSDPSASAAEAAGVVLVQVLESDKHPLDRNAHMI